MAAGEIVKLFMKTTLLKIVMAAAALCGLAALLLCGLVLRAHYAGPAGGTALPFPDAATLAEFDPLTALSLLMIALGVLLARFRSTRLPGRVIAIVGSLGALMGMADRAFGTTYAALLPSWLGFPPGQPAGSGMDGATAAAILCYGIASVASLFKRYGLAQAAAAIALLPSLANGIGCLLGTEVMFGRLPTLVLAVTALCGAAMLGGIANRGSIRVFLSKTISGSFARQQILLATVIPIGLAVFFARLLPAGEAPHALADTVATIIVIAWITIGATALVGRRLDLKRHRAEAELRNLARHDPLTGLLNRRSMNSALPQRYARAQRDGRPITLMMCDLDHFKGLNDEHGHGVGDDVLRRTAERVSAAVRDSDLVFRYGGEEIAVLLDCGPVDAVRIAEKIRESVKAPGRRAGDTELPSVTVSIGAATSEGAQTELGRIMGLADECLYAANDAGRDCVRHATLP